jgi:predicted nucleic acid-binding protein
MDQSDQDHGVCAELIARRTEQLVVPAPVLVELDWLASSRLGPGAFESFLADIEDGTIRVIDLTRADYRRVRELCSRYRDLPLGFVDAAVLAVTERMGEPKLVTLDYRHFRVVRPQHGVSLVLLPEEGQQ